MDKDLNSTEDYGEDWFFRVGALENNYMAAKRALYRLGRVCDVEVGD